MCPSDTFFAEAAPQRCIFLYEIAEAAAEVAALTRVLASRRTSRTAWCRTPWRGGSSGGSAARRRAADRARRGSSSCTRTPGSETRHSQTLEIQ